MSGPAWRPRHVGLVMPTSFDAGSVIAGGERYAFELSRALAALVPTTLFTFGSQARTQTVGPLTIRCFRPLGHAGGVHNPVSVAHLRPLLACDVIHCLQPRTIVTDFAMLWGWLWRRRTFLTDLAGGAGVPRQHAADGQHAEAEGYSEADPWVRSRPGTLANALTQR